MTPEQQANVESVGDAIRSNPRPWNGLNLTEQSVLQTALMPGADGFTDEQRAYLGRWWLQCTQSDVDAINALIPPPENTVITARTGLDGNLYLSADLLSDALQGKALAHTLDILKTLVLRYKLADAWPAPVE